MNSSRLTFSFQVPNNPCDELQLQYFPDERCFCMIRKGKVEDKIQPQVFKDKESLEIEPRQTGDTLRNASCSSISPTFQVSSSKEQRLYYVSEERRFTLIEKGTAQTDPHSFIHMGKQGEFSESFKIQPPPLNVDGNIVDVLVSETHSYLDKSHHVSVHLDGIEIGLNSRGPNAK
ncbi:hypothetical protein PVK06_030427 [Gossypium arboreum]|uniref:Uncharacterized protein n=1 Tax=Gossypium arboreum TaxID=29729 RepID=A0ABR0NNT4_GOSAR|nr:hypothetical protein PVK06_030427 [Gossypium arboreum]